MKLFVDFDGTLQRSDLLWEQLIRILVKKPFALPSLALTLAFKGRACFKNAIAKMIQSAAIQLPWNPEVMAFVKTASATQEVVVLTAGDEVAVRTALEAEGLSWKVVGSRPPDCNVKGKRKAEILMSLCPNKENSYYIGDSIHDFPVWKAANQGGFVGSLRRRLQLEQLTGRPFDSHFNIETNLPRTLIRALRPHQWLKNLLVFVPLLAAHRWADPQAWFCALTMFVSFCAAASTIYLINDLCDLDSDRCHPAKKHRPIAAGLLLIPAAIVSVVFLLGVSFLFVPRSANSLAILVAYLMTATFYSLAVKKVLALDIVILSLLYTIRILAGAFATQIVPSVWLMVFSGFSFFSLASGKRYAELVHLSESATVGRAYVATHSIPLAAIGGASAMTSVLVLALYTQDSQLGLYRNPELLLLVCPVLMFWFCRFWLRAADGRVDFDPVLDAARDITTWVCLIAVAIVVLFAI